MTAQPAPAPVVCEVSLRARLMVGEPFFAPGRPFTLGRVGTVDAAAGDLVAVAVTGPGRGAVTERLGQVGDVSAVLHGLAIEAGAAAPWPDDVAAEVARLPAEPPVDEGERADLRGVLTLTIDPADARDHDDALSVDGERVLVHIADVAAFVPDGGAIDREASRRATSVYLPGRVDPMLPERLSSDLCSLLPGRDRWAVTVEVGGDGRFRAFRSIVRSDHRLTYEEAELLLATGEGPPELVAALRRLDQLARDRGSARLARGGVAVDAPERAFRIESGAVVEGHSRRSGPAHALVEELMLAANEAVAAELAAAGVAAPFRVHEPPEPDALLALVDRLEALSVPTPARPDVLPPAEAARFAGARQPDGGGVCADIRPRPGRVPRHGAAGAPQGSLRPPESGTFRAREPGVLPLHLADPPPSRRDGAPGAPAAPGARHLAAARPGRGGRGCGARLRGRARGRGARAQGDDSAPHSCSRAPCTSAAGTRPSPARSSD